MILFIFVIVVVFGLVILVSRKLKRDRLQSEFVEKKQDIALWLEGLELQINEFDVSRHSSILLEELKRKHQELKNAVPDWEVMVEDASRLLKEAQELNSYIAVESTMLDAAKTSVASLRYFVPELLIVTEKRAMEINSAEAAREIQKARSKLSNASSIARKYGNDSLLWQFVLLEKAKEHCVSVDRIMNGGEPVKV